MSETIPRCPKANLKIVTENDLFGYWVCKVPAEHTLENVKSPAYFGYLIETETQKAIRAGDKIEVMPHSMEWCLELRVRAVDPLTGQCHTAVMNEREFDADLELPDGWTAEYINENSLWAVIYGGSRKEVGLPTREAAINRGRAMAAQAGISMPEDKPKTAPKKRTPTKAEKEDA